MVMFLFITQLVNKLDLIIELGREPITYEFKLKVLSVLSATASERDLIITRVGDEIKKTKKEKRSSYRNGVFHGDREYFCLMKEFIHHSNIDFFKHYYEDPTKRTSTIPNMKIFKAVGPIAHQDKFGLAIYEVLCIMHIAINTPE